MSDRGCDTKRLMQNPYHAPTEVGGYWGRRFYELLLDVAVADTLNVPERNSLNGASRNKDADKAYGVASRLFLVIESGSVSTSGGLPIPSRPGDHKKTPLSRGL